MLTSRKHRAASVLGVRTVAVALVLVAGLAASPASAETVHRHDARGDARAAVDILRVTYNNGTKRIGAVVKFRDLKGQGRVQVWIAKKMWLTQSWLPKVTKNSDGLHSGLFFVNTTGRTRQRCHVSAHWSAGHDRVQVSAPQSCLKPKQTSWYMKTTSGSVAKGDAIRKVLVRHA